MNTEELRKLLKSNGICAYTYWGKDKLIELAKINNLLPEEPKEPEIPERQKVSWQKLRNIRNTPVKVKLIDIETGEEKIFPSIYRTAKYLDKSPQTIRHYGNLRASGKKNIRL